ncbi:MAG TPA: hypothetical protein VFV50_13590 [Bdellovibrionales bacterium]|nr:hypothetical protein [Bdellovibrionales bacterium]
MAHLQIIGVLALALGLTACTRGPKAPFTLGETERASIEALQADPWAKERWLHKTASLLRYRQGLDAADDVEALKSQPPEAVVAALMRDARFGDATLDFALYFLGKRPNSLRDARGWYREQVLLIPQAVSAARETLRDGDFLQLLNFDQPYYGLPLRPIQGGEPAREKLFKDAVAHFDRLAAEVEAGMAAGDKNLTCKTAGEYMVHPAHILVDAGMTLVLYDHLMNSPEWFGEHHLYCVSSGTGPAPDLVRYRAIRPKFLKLIDALKTQLPANYAPTELAKLRALDSATMSHNGFYNQLTNRLWAKIDNSTTNYNRRRAAFFLKRFFCDDLTPVNVALPSAHVTGRHGSEPSCMACHYKLDPMAGFFKDVSHLGVFYGTASHHHVKFSDGPTQLHNRYVTEWRAPESAPRPWLVGYIRSMELENENTYGEALPDLFRIIQTAPEVKACLTRRVYEYALGEGRSVDASYLSYLERAFSEEAKVNSARAFKMLLTRIVLSGAFAHPNPDPNECYDYAPGVNPQARPPCQVAFIFEKNCASCHGPTAAKGGLRLTEWVATEGGARGFTHKKAGQQLPARESFTRILNRLTTSDPDARMPMGQSMPDPERVILVKWLEEQLKKGAP